MVQPNRFLPYSERPTGAAPGRKQPGLGYPVGGGWAKLDNAKAQCVDLMSTDPEKFGTMRVVDAVTGKIVYQCPAEDEPRG
jgi:hypothetical protein